MQRHHVAQSTGLGLAPYPHPSQRGVTNDLDSRYRWVDNFLRGLNAQTNTYCPARDMGCHNRRGFLALAGLGYHSPEANGRSDEIPNSTNPLEM